MCKCKTQQQRHRRVKRNKKIFFFIINFAIAIIVRASKYTKRKKRENTRAISNNIEFMSKFSHIIINLSLMCPFIRLKKN